MESTLKEKEQVWIQNDNIYKQRRIVLNYIVKLNLEINFDHYMYLVLSKEREQNRNLNGCSYELIFFMIQHIL